MGTEAEPCYYMATFQRDLTLLAQHGFFISRKSGEKPELRCDACECAYQRLGFYNALEPAASGADSSTPLLAGKPGRNLKAIVQMGCLAKSHSLLYFTPSERSEKTIVTKKFSCCWHSSELTGLVESTHQGTGHRKAH